MIQKNYELLMLMAQTTTADTLINTPAMFPEHKLITLLT